MLKLQESSVTVCKTQPLCVPKHSKQKPALSCVDSRPSTPRWETHQGCVLCPVSLPMDGYGTSAAGTC